MTPWNEGGREETYQKMGIAMSHDDLAALLGEAYKTITDAGFVLVPKWWLDAVREERWERAERERSKP